MTSPQLANERRWRAGAVTAGRALAILALATGLAGWAGSAWPAFDERWLYVIAAGIIGLTGGFIAGIVSAIVAVLAYETMSHGAIGFHPAYDLLIAGGGTLAAIAGGSVRLLWSRAATRRSPLTTDVDGEAIGARVDDDERTVFAARKTIDDSAIEARDGIVPPDRPDPSLTLGMTGALGMTGDTEQLQRQLAMANAEAASLERRVDRADHAREAAERRSRELEAELEEMRRRVDEANAAAASSQASVKDRLAALGRTSEMESRIGQLQEQLADAASDLQEVRSGLAEANSARSMLEAELARARHELATATNDVAQSHDRMSAVESELAGSHAALSEFASVRSSLEAELSGLRQELAAAWGALENARTSVSEAALARATFEAQTEDARRLLDERTAELNSLRAALAEAADGRASLETGLAESRRELAAAREEAAGLAVRLTEAEALQRMRGDEAGGAARELVSARSRIESLEQVLAARDERLRQAERDLAAAQASAEALNRRVRDLDGARAAAEMDRSRVEMDLVQMRASLNAKIAELQSLRGAAENEREKSEHEIARIGLEAAGLAARVDELAAHRAADAERHTRVEAEWRQNLEQTAADVVALTARLSAAEAERDEILARVATAEVEREQMIASRAETAAEWNARMVNAAAENARLLGRIQELENDSGSAEQRHAVETAALRSQIDGSAAEVTRLTARVAELELARDAADAERLRNEAEWQNRMAATTLELTAQFDEKLRAARSETDSAASRVSELERELSAIAARTAEERAQIEEHWRHQFQQHAERVSHDHEIAIRQVVLERDQAHLYAVSLSGRLAEMESSLRDLTAAHEALAGERDAFRSAAEQERIRAQEEIEKRLDLDSDWAAKLDVLAHSLRAEHEAALAAIASERDGAANESRSLVARVEILQQELHDSREELQAALAERRTLVDEIQRHQQAAADAESHARRLSQMNDALRDTAATVETLTAENAQLRDRLRLVDDARSEAGSLAARIESLETALREAFATADSVRAENATLRDNLHLERARLAEEGSVRARMDAEWNEKLQRIVNNLASDHEADMGQAMLEREEARAEGRKLTLRVQALEGTLREISETHDAMQRENAELRAASEQERSRADHEAALREKIDAEWNEKLQTIVSHLATDHESDMGQAMLEKEEARAEARSLTMKLSTLTRALESEREAFRNAAQNWVNERHALMQEIESARSQKKVIALPVDAVSALAEPFGDLTASAADVARPASPAAHASTSPRPTVVLVHRDAALRTMVRDALERSGYSVTTASDGLEAFRIALAQKPDAILAEAQMPKMDGRELVQLLKSRPETSGVKIVLMTGDHDAPREGAEEFRADDFLRDPANVESLRATLEQVLAGAR